MKPINYLLDKYLFSKHPLFNGCDMLYNTSVWEITDDLYDIFDFKRVCELECKTGDNVINMFFGDFL